MRALTPTWSPRRVVARRNLADILSVLAMTASEGGSRESLRFRLEGGGESVGVWGHEYVRCAGHTETIAVLEDLTIRRTAQSRSFL